MHTASLSISTSDTQKMERRRKVIVSSFIGTVLEWYDFYIYGTAATIVFGALFFPNLDPTSGMLASFAAYGIGFFLKPVGGVILSRFGDTIGRKKVMVVSLVTMGLATGSVGLLPTYNEIGVWAPILLVFLRLVQSIGAGAEYGGALTMIAEFSGKQKRGFLASLPALGVSLGILLGTGMFAALSTMQQEAFMAWGWRIPFLIGFTLAAVGLYMRLQAQETPAFEQLKQADRILRSPFTHVLKHEWRRLVIAAGARSAEAVGAQLFNVFAIAYCTKTLGMAPSVGLTGVMAANFIGLLVIPIGGLLSDRFGRKQVFLPSLIFLAAFAFPFFWLLDTKQPMLVLVAFVLAYGFGVKMIFATSGAYLTELFDVRTRSTGVTFARTISDPIAGMTPLIATALYAWSGAYWSVALFLIGFVGLAFACVAIGPETRTVEMADFADDSAGAVAAKRRR
ncbi:MHS family MFS transporter [Bradyrhizobium manausense]|uniref:MFS transporter n=1 Tax=Bradyrhizobium manausense TaxID=989370 RepID=UPI001BA5EB17|nr:MFS transporter [Bradyrhizobium manausense]MBR0828649.1 MHS family MFS transporter [Bradyrhizobium manausense]